MGAHRSKQAVAFVQDGGWVIQHQRGEPAPARPLVDLSAPASAVVGGGMVEGIRGARGRIGEHSAVVGHAGDGHRYVDAQGLEPVYGPAQVRRST